MKYGPADDFLADMHALIRQREVEFIEIKVEQVRSLIGLAEFTEIEGIESALDAAQGRTCASNAVSFVVLKIVP